MRPLYSTTFLAVSLTAALLQTAAANASDSYCGASNNAALAAELDGFYEVQNGPGVLTMAGRTMALPTGNSSDAAIEVSEDGAMKIMSSQIGGEFDLQLYNGPPWTIAKNPESPLEDSALLTTTDIGVLAGCDPNDLPRLFATGTYTDPDSGQNVEFKLHLFALNDSLLHGVTVGEIRTPNGPGTAQRSITLSR